VTRWHALINYNMRKREDGEEAEVEKSAWVCCALFTAMQDGRVNLVRGSGISGTGKVTVIISETIQLGQAGAKSSSSSEKASYLLAALALTTQVCHGGDTN